jgi:hypothetical protein
MCVAQVRVPVREKGLKIFTTDCNLKTTDFDAKTQPALASSQLQYVMSPYDTTSSTHKASASS